ncbi:16S rRNA methyltransferase [Sulfuracidifex metallicus]|uniref:16S rRNA methyltransferase n=1 Tax=Sulfuracidifex metallicus TaxID=47303 RepID=UPI002275D935|nr:16S rRNA methyltransferase [Sulfuracidifex metallicus]MCY0849475.1 16S rRNA methyltransferase [Sulfuracidifex metallicus]
MFLNVILLDSALETVPKELLDHPAVKNNARRRKREASKTILDVSIHYHAMKNLKDKEKRGRPDIIHSAMVLLLTDPVIKVNLYIHTINSIIIKVNPEIRPPKNYDRFLGLMEQLFEYRKIPPNSQTPLIEILDETLDDILSKYKLALLTEKGEKKPPSYLCELGEDWIIGLGGFPHGDFSQEVYKRASSLVSISNYVLETQSVICRLIGSCNQLTGWA